MSGILAALAGIKTAIATAVDTYFNLTTLLLSGNGTNGAQNNTFLDSSTNNFTITRNGNTTQGTFSPFSQTGWSGSFAGTASVTSNLAGSTTMLPATSTSTFTIDFWIYPTSFAGNPAIIGDMDPAIGGSLNYISAQISTSGNPQLYWYDGASRTCTASTALTLNAWNYVAIRVSSNAISIFVNSATADTVSGTTTLTTRSGARNFAIGQFTSGQYLNGYLSNVRVSTVARTIAVPTAAFTPDADTRILALSENRFSIYGTAASTLTPTNVSVQAFSPFSPTAAYSAATNGGSGYFDGTGDFLSSSSTLTFGTNAFTVEFWVYPLAASTGMVFCCSTNGAIQVQLVASSGQLNLNIGTYGTGATLSTTGTPVKLNQWNHVVAVRSATSTNGAAIFVNGSRNIQGTVSTNYVAGAINVGAIPGGTQSVNGYMSGFVVTNGTANYSPSDTSITVPTAPPSPTGSTLCINFTNGGIIDATGENVLETVGNAQISTTQSKFGGSSMYFDGTGDYITSVANTGLALGSGDFTVEMWVYPTSFATYKTIWGCTSAVNVTTGFHVGANASGQMFIYSNSAFRISSSANSGVLTLNQWNYLAIVRSSGVVRIYVNGVVATSTWSTTQDFSQGYNVIGAAPGGGSEYFTGYIDDLRTTKGVARTVTTSPTSAFALQ